MQVGGAKDEGRLTRSHRRGGIGGGCPFLARRSTMAVCSHCARGPAAGSRPRRRRGWSSGTSRGRPPTGTSHATTTIPPRGGGWRDVSLDAGEQITFSTGNPLTGYACEVIGGTVALQVTHDGGTSWRPVIAATPIASEICLLAIDDLDPAQVALLARVTAPDPCQSTACTPTPCVGACQPCIDYCPPPPMQMTTLHLSADGGSTWHDAGALPTGVHFASDIAYAGGTLYAWTDTWPTLLAARSGDGPFQLVDLSAYFPAAADNNSYQPVGASTHLWPLRGQLFVPVPGSDFADRFIVTADGGTTWTRRDFAANGDPVDSARERPGWSHTHGRAAPRHRLSGAIHRRRLDMASVSRAVP